MATPNPPAALPATAAPSSDLRDFAWKAHSYVNEYIRYGDAKAGVVFTVGLAILGALYAAKAHKVFTSAAPSAWDTRAWVMLAAFALLFLGLIAAAWVVRPRLWTSQPPAGLIFWDRVVQHSSGAGYLEALQLHSDQDLTREVAEHVYDLCRVARDKFRWVSVAVNLTIAGAVLGALLLIVGG